MSRRLELLRAELRSARDESGNDIDAAQAPSLLPAPDEHTHIRPGGPSDPWLPPGQEAGASAVELPAPSPPSPAGPNNPASPVPTAEVPSVPSSAPPEVPSPGRHAARRRGGGRLVDLSAVQGRVTLTSAHVAVVAVLVAVGMAVTTWWVLRDDPGAALARSAPTEPLESPLVLDPSAPAPDASGSGSAVAELVVDVAGKVRRPGIVVLEPGSRVVDALEAAGGARPGIKLTGLNLARPLQDGEQIVVGVARPPGLAASTAPEQDGGESGGALVNINTASATELEELSGVGPVTAEAIIEWRTSNGGFQSVDQLLEVDGIGEKTLADLSPHVTVG